MTEREQLEQAIHQLETQRAILGVSVVDPMLAAAREKLATLQASTRPAAQSLSTHLNTLEDSGLIRPAQIEPDLEYLFRHALVQDAAYESLLKSDRHILHRVVGETLARFYPEQLDELAAVLALHFAAAEERPRAIDYFRRAARYALSRYAYEESQQHLRAALDLLLPNAGPHELRAELLEELADSYQLTRNGKPALLTYQAALEQWAGAEAETLRLQRKILETFFNMLQGGQVEQVRTMLPALERARSALQVQVQKAATQPPTLETIRQLVALSKDAWEVYLLGGAEEVSWEQVENYARAAIRLAEQLNAPQDLVAALGSLAAVHYAHSQLREHLDITLRQLAVSREAGFSDLRGQVNISSSVASALVYVGDYQQAIAYTLEAETLADRIRAVFSRVMALGVQSQCWFRLDRWADMFRIADKRAELEKLYPREQVGFTCFEIGLTATVHALRGEMLQARQLREQAYAIMAGPAPDPAKWARNQHY